jgi:hypothetical protein
MWKTPEDSYQDLHMCEKDVTHDFMPIHSHVHMS